MKTPRNIDRYKKRAYRGREIDNEAMDFNEFETHPHKDYLGHIFRWGWANQFINKQTRVLDVGCGSSLPLMRVFGGPNHNFPEFYLGVDAGKVKYDKIPKWAQIIDEFDFTNPLKNEVKESSKFDVVVCFEVFEHMSEEKGKRLLENIYNYMNDDAILIFSAPVYCSTYKMAKFHINELTKVEMEDALEGAGLYIKEQFGVFSNINDIKKVASKEEMKLYRELGKFYGNDILGAFLAPKYPEAARNILHVCTKNPSDRCEVVKSVLKNDSKPL